jgi:regulator of sigma D
MIEYEEYDYKLFRTAFEILETFCEDEFIEYFDKNLATIDEQDTTIEYSVIQQRAIGERIINLYDWYQEYKTDTDTNLYPDDKYKDATDKLHELIHLRQHLWT